MVEDAGVGDALRSSVGTSTARRAHRTHARPQGEYREWLLDAGFREVTTMPCTSLGTTGVIVARA